MRRGPAHLKDNCLKPQTGRQVFVPLSRPCTHPMSNRSGSRAPSECIHRTCVWSGCARKRTCDALSWRVASLISASGQTQWPVVDIIASVVGACRETRAWTRVLSGTHSQSLSTTPSDQMNATVVVSGARVSKSRLGGAGDSVANSHEGWMGRRGLARSCRRQAQSCS